MANQGTVLSMKLLIDKANKKVLFAEAGKESVDFFFHILSLPLGTIVGFLTKESMVGSVGRLYANLESLSTDYIAFNFNKDCLLNPQPSLGASSQIPLLTGNHQDPRDLEPKATVYYTCITSTEERDYHNMYSINDVVHRYVSDGLGASCPQCHKKMDQVLTYFSPPLELKRVKLKGVGASSHIPLLTKCYYTCITSTEKRSYDGMYFIKDVVHRYVSDGLEASCPQCHKKMDQELSYVSPPPELKVKLPRCVGGYVKGVVTYMIMDDLSIKPMSNISSITLLNKLGIQDMSSLEEKEVTLDIKLGVALLKASLMSNNALTDVFLPKKP